MRNLIFLSIILNLHALSTLNAGGTLSLQEPIVDTSESKEDIEDSYNGTYLSLLPKELVKRAFLLKQIEEARRSRLVPFVENGLVGKVTADKKNKIYDTKGWLLNGSSYSSLRAFSNNRKIGIASYVRDYSGGCDVSLLLRKFEWNSSGNTSDELWRKEISISTIRDGVLIGGFRSNISVASNDGTNIFVMKADLPQIVWWKLEIVDPGILRYWKDKCGQEIAEINIAIPEEHQDKIESIGYLNSFKKLCLFDKNQDVLCLIDLNEYDSK